MSALTLHTCGRTWLARPQTSPLLPLALALTLAPRVVQVYAPAGDGELSAQEIMVAVAGRSKKEKKVALMGAPIDGFAIENFPPMVQDKLR